jgi:hypothetical protein
MKTPSLIRSIGAALALAFGLAGSASAVQITFQVDMSIQAALGNFTPGVDAVQVAGSWPANNWTPANGVLTQSLSDPDVYEGTFDITGTVGSTVSYKFVYGAAGWEVNGVGPGGANDRQLSLPATDTVLPVVYYNNVDTLPSTRLVTFQVNLTVQREIGNFDPANDFVYVAGEFNAWSASASELIQSSTDTNVWEGTFTVAGNAGGTVNYKFLLATFASGEVWEINGVGPGGVQNRQLTLEAIDQTLPEVYFNNLDTIPVTVPVTFQVNMAAQMALGNYVDGVNTVTAAGTFNNWDAISFVLTNDPAEPTIYKGTTEVIGAVGGQVSFQYVIDGVTWETAVGDRAFNLADSAQSLAPVFWNNVDDLGLITTTSLGGNQVRASWTPVPLARLQISTGLPAGWSDVPNTTGESNAVVNLTADETYFRLIGP